MSINIRKLSGVLGDIDHEKAEDRGNRKERFQQGKEVKYRKAKYKNIKNYIYLENGLGLCTRTMEIIWEMGWFMFQVSSYTVQ